MVHGVVDAVQADADPARRQEDEGEKAGPGGDQDALEPTAAPGTRLGHGNGRPRFHGDPVSSKPPPSSRPAPAPGPRGSPCPKPTDPPLPRRCPKGSMWLPWPRRDPPAVRHAGGMGEDRACRRARRRRAHPRTATPRPTRTAPAGGTSPSAPATSWSAPGPNRGTTWVQMICLLLVYGSPDLPGSLGALSPWLDHLVRPKEEVFARLAAQRVVAPARRRTPLSTACHSTAGSPTSWWAVTRSTWRSRSTTRARTSTGGAWPSSPGTPRPTVAGAPAAARVAARLHRLGRRSPGVARHAARGDAAPVRRLGATGRPQRRCWCTTTTCARTSTAPCAVWPFDSASRWWSGAGPPSSRPPPSSRCGSARGRRIPTPSAC